MNPMPGRGFVGWGGGWGRGHRWRHWYHATGLPGWARAGYGPYVGPPSEEQQVEFLKAQAQGLQEQLDAINKQLADLKSEE
jgi:hypothetical protein